MCYFRVKTCSGDQRAVNDRNACLSRKSWGWKLFVWAEDSLLTRILLILRPSKESAKAQNLFELDWKSCDSKEAEVEPIFEGWNKEFEELNFPSSEIWLQFFYFVKIAQAVAEDHSATVVPFPDLPFCALEQLNPFSVHLENTLAKINQKFWFLRRKDKTKYHVC